MKYMSVAIVIVACLAGAVVLIVTDHPWWAALFCVFAATPSVKESPGLAPRGEED